MNKLVRTILFVVLLAAVLLACSVPGLGGSVDYNATNTAIFQIIETRAALGNNALMPTAPLLPGEQPVIIATPEPVFTKTGTCDRAAFVSETVPDNAAYAPGVSFLKTWKLKNIGDCTWDSGYTLVFVSGTSMGEDVVDLPQSVAPGETVDASITLKAPDQPGTYRGYYMLRNAEGEEFALGSDAGKPFWVLIVVRTLNATLDPNATVTVSPGFINLLDYAPNATWHSCTAPCAAKADLPFDGPESETKGYIKYRGSPTLENDQQHPRVLEIHPPKDDSGTIYGIFPPYTVRRGDHFRAQIGFVKTGNPATCEGGNANFQLGYMTGGAMTTLQSWQETCDGKLQNIDVDLNTIADKEVQIVLIVISNGPSTNDNTVWIDARIEP